MNNQRSVVSAPNLVAADVSPLHLIALSSLQPPACCVQPLPLPRTSNWAPSNGLLENKCRVDCTLCRVDGVLERVPVDQFEAGAYLASQLSPGSCAGRCPLQRVRVRTSESKSKTKDWFMNDTVSTLTAATPAPVADTQHAFCAVHGGLRSVSVS